MSSNSTCHNCGSSEFETDPARGDTVCTKCGIVIEDNAIVNEIQFEEGNFGGTHVVGQRVTDEYSMRSLSVGGLLGSGGKQSRIITLENAKRKIKTVGNLLNLNSVCIEQAFGFYKMALNRRLTHGRKNSHVIAACVYMVCRLEFTPHILLDLSDVMQVNVYDLGKTYLKLSSVLCLNIPPIDPCIYIMRYAHKLEIKEKSNEVQMTALRLVSRMKRDWMHTGRRPSGLCGAALLVSARLHGLHCSIKDVIKVVKVCETTIRKRLNEFGDTPSSKLTLEEFLSVDLEGEEDPPCYKTARKKNKDGTFEEKTEKNDLEFKEDLNIEIEQLQKKIDEAIEKSRKKFKGPYAKYAKITEDTNNALINLNDENEITRHIIESSTVETIKNVLTNNFREDALCFDQIKDLRPTAESLGLDGNFNIIEATDTFELDNSLSVTKEFETTVLEKKNELNKSTSGELYFEDLDDEELDSYLLSQKEIETKTSYWLKFHADYLKEMEEKEKKKKLEEESRREREAKGEISPKKKRKSRKRTSYEAANSAGEAIEKMLQEKKISNKINYDVLKKLTDFPYSEDNKKAKETTEDQNLENEILKIKNCNSSSKRLPSQIKSQSLNINTENKISKFKTQTLKSKLCSNLLSSLNNTKTPIKQILPNESIETKKDEVKEQKIDNHYKNNSIVEEEDEDLDEDDDDDYFNLEKERNQLSIANLMSDNFQTSNYEAEEEYDYDYD